MTDMRKKLYIGAAVALSCLMACQEADKVMYPLNEVEGVYFKADSMAFYDANLTQREDTVVYSFAYEDESFDHYRIGIPVQVAGEAVDKDRTYRLEILEGGNAVETEDYEPFALEQVLHANRMVDTLWVTWKRSEVMQKSARMLGLQIVAGGELIPGVEEKLTLWLLASDILEEPSWWDDWEVCFGTYHPTKLREWIKIWGNEPLDENLWMGPNWFEYPQECTAILKLKDVFEQNEFYDEQEVRLYIPGNI